MEVCGWMLTPLLEAPISNPRFIRGHDRGDGVSHTSNGMPIDIFDQIGIQRDESVPGMRFEAAFTPAGAVLVRQRGQWPGSIITSSRGHFPEK